MRSFKNSHKLLTGFLALVLVAGMTSPAFAQQVEPQRTTVSEEASIRSEEIMAMLEEANIVFDNGGGPQTNVGWCYDSGTGQTVAEDFILP